MRKATLGCRRCVLLVWTGCVLALASWARGSGEPAKDTADHNSEPAPRVNIATSAGDIVVALDAERAPISVSNFLEYADAGFYDGTVFHRVKPDGLIQGGAYTKDMDLKTDRLHPPILCEADNGLKNEKDTIAFYRDVGKLDSATAQFFINLKDNPNFDEVRDGSGYAVFGKVVSGADVLERIASSPTGTNPKYAAGYSAVVPTKPIFIKSVQQVAPIDRSHIRVLAHQAQARIVHERSHAAMSDEERAAQSAEDLEKKYSGKFVKTESGLRYLNVRAGKGIQPTIEDTVEIQFQVTLLDGSLVESTYAGKPRTREMGRLVQGLQEGIQTMKEGGQSIFIVPPELAYGEDGQPGIIPGNAWLVFNIELLMIK